MFRLIAHTQYMENYGDAESPRWKFKGGSEYVIARLTTEQVVELGKSGLDKLVDAALSQITWSDEYTESYFLDWELIAPGELTPDEKTHMEYEGRILWHPKELEVSVF